MHAVPMNHAGMSRSLSHSQCLSLLRQAAALLASPAASSVVMLVAFLILAHMAGRHDRYYDPYARPILFAAR